MPKTIFAEMLDRVRAVNAQVLNAAADQSRVVVEPPRDPSHGDMATNAAMVLAKDAGKKPRELADAIALKLRDDPLVDKVDVAGPGFINMTLKPAAWTDELVPLRPAGVTPAATELPTDPLGSINPADLAAVAGLLFALLVAIVAYLYVLRARRRPPDWIR